MAQDGHVPYLPIMKFQSLKISNTLLIKWFIHYINITKNRKMISQIQPKTYKWPQMDLDMSFDFGILKLETDKSMKTKKTLKHWLIRKTHLKPPWTT